MKKEGIKIISNNKKASHDYFLIERLEAGIVLKGTEVKSIRQGKTSIKESFCFIEKGEIFIHGMHITPYEMGNRFNVDETRKRKLLLHKREISKLLGKIKEEGYTIVPTKVYIKNNLVKIEIAIAKGKKKYDKRETIAKRDAERRMRQALRQRY